MWLKIFRSVVERTYTFQEMVIAVLAVYILTESPVWYMAADWSDGDEKNKALAGAGQVIAGGIGMAALNIWRDWMKEQKGVT